MNLSKLVVAAVSIAAFALVWVPGRSSGNGADGFGARAHRALAHVVVPDQRADADGTPGRIEAPLADRVDAGRTRVVPAPTSTAPTSAASEPRARGADRSRPS